MLFTAAIYCINVYRFEYYISDFLTPEKTGSPLPSAVWVIDRCLFQCMLLRSNMIDDKKIRVFKPI